MASTVLQYTSAPLPHKTKVKEINNTPHYPQLITQNVCMLIHIWLVECMNNYKGQMRFHKFYKAALYVFPLNLILFSKYGNTVLLLISKSGVKQLFILQPQVGLLYQLDDT